VASWSSTTLALVLIVAIDLCLESGNGSGERCHLF
jgi:hypothetical protein